MNTYVDLNSFLRKPLIIKGLNKVDKDGKEIKGKEFIIPAQMPTSFVLKYSAYIQEQNKITNGEVKQSDEEFLNGLYEMVLEIINLDKQHKYTVKDVKENFDDLIILQKVVEVVGNYIYGIESNPNSESPQSK